jgi:hypothetical protein
MPWIKALDTSILTMSPVFSMLLLSGWVLGGLGAFRIGVSLELVRPLLAGLMALAFVLTGTAAAAVLMQVRSNRVSYVKMILATYPYAALITLASAAGMILVATGMGRKMWFKTPKTGFRDQRWEAGT